MIGTILWLTYLGGGIFFWRRFAWEVALKDADGRYERIEGDNVFWGALVGCGMALIWPVIIVGRLINRRHGIHWFLAPDKESRRKIVQAKVDKELRDKERELAQLDRDLQRAQRELESTKATRNYQLDRQKEMAMGYQK